MAGASPKSIGLTTATIIGINAMIGAGIFTAPAAIGAHVGPAGIVVYLLVIGAVWCMAQSMARLAYLFPQSGSFYVYASQWGGARAGIIASSLYLLGMLVGMGLLTQSIGAYLQYIFPSISMYGGALAALAVLFFLNVWGVRLSKVGQQVLVICTLAPMIAIIALCLSRARFAALVPFAPYGWMNVFKATRIAIFGFFGFESAASLWPVVKDPHQVVPKALTYSVLIVGAIYIVFVTAIILAVPLDYFVDPSIPLTVTLYNVFGHRWLVGGIHIAVLSALLGTVHSMMWGAAALLLSLSNKFPLIRVWNVSHTKGIIAVTLGIAATATFLNNPDLFFNITALLVVSAFMMAMITLLTIKKEWNSGNNVITLVGLCAAGVMVYFAGQGVINQACWYVNTCM